MAAAVQTKANRLIIDILIQVKIGLHVTSNNLPEIVALEPFKL